MRRVLVLGLDGVGPDYFERALTLGVFPFLGQIARRGVSAPAFSTTPPVSTAAWTTITTGVGIGKHGVVDFYRRDVARFDFGRPGRLVTSADVRWPRVYDLAGRRGLKSFILNVPVTYPAPPVNGVLVSGVTTPPGSPRGYYPPEFAPHLAGYRYDLDDPVPADLAGLCRELTALERQRARVAAGAMKRDRYDLALVVFTGPDRLFHRYYREVYTSDAPPAAVVDYLRALDAAAAEVAAAFGDDALTLLCSDHGFTAGPTNLFFVNRVLRAARFLKLRGYGTWSLNYLQGGIRKLLGKSASPLEVDAAASAAYGFPFYMKWGAVALNVRGEQPNGPVPPGDVRAVSADIIDLLLSQQSQGRPAVKWARRREELYDGPALPSLPHVIFECAEGYAVSEAKGPGPVTCPHPFPLKQGDHDPRAILVAAGPDLTPGARNLTSIGAVAATAAAALGLDPSLMDSQPLC